MTSCAARAAREIARPHRTVQSHDGFGDHDREADEASLAAHDVAREQVLVARTHHGPTCGATDLTSRRLAS